MTEGSKKYNEWDRIKSEGSEHYKASGGVEPIDLYKSGDILRDFAVACIIKYAYRNRREVGKPVDQKDMKKIKHYADMLGEIIP